MDRLHCSWALAWRIQRPMPGRAEARRQRGPKLRPSEIIGGHGLRRPRIAADACKRVGHLGYALCVEVNKEAILYVLGENSKKRSIFHT